MDNSASLHPANGSSAPAIAARVRGLIGGQDRGSASALADRLGVSELALRMTIDPDEPQPNLLVLLAVVREYAVDPMWLLTGDYSLATHRQAMEDDRVATATVLEEMRKRSQQEPSPKNSRPALRLIDGASA
jgi:hypothetical protein